MVKSIKSKLLKVLALAAACTFAIGAFAACNETPAPSSDPTDPPSANDPAPEEPEDPETPETPEEPETPANIKTLDVNVMSFNVRTAGMSADKDAKAWGERREAVATYLSGQNASVICMQEVKQEQYAYLRDALSDKYTLVWYPRASGENVEGLAIAYETAVYNKVDETVFWLSNTPNVQSVGWDASYPRICVNVVLENKTTGVKLDVYDVHFDHVGETAQLESAKLLAQRASASEYNAAVVMGDFNVNNTTQAYTELATAMQDCQAIAPQTESGATYSNWGTIDTATGKAIDFCFVSKETVAPQTYEIRNEDRWGENSENCYSDHYAIKMKLQVSYDGDETTVSSASAFTKEIGSAADYAEFAQSAARNTYAGWNVVITENIELADGFAKLPYNFAGNIATADGKKIVYDSSTGYAPLAERDEMVANVAYECKIDSALTVTESNYTNLVRTSHTNSDLTYFTPAQVAAMSFDGGYTGAAIGIHIYTANYSLRYAVDSVTVENEDDVKYVAFWMATDGTEGYTRLGTYSGSAMLLANDLMYPASPRISSENANTWTRYIVSYEDFKTAATEDGGSLVSLFRSARVDGFTASYFVYLGNVEFLTEIPDELKHTQIPTLSATTVFYAPDNDPTSPSASKVSLINASETGLTGAYTGDTALKVGKVYTNNSLFLDADLQYYELTGYTHLSVWVGCDAFTAGYMNVGDSTSLVPSSANFNSTNAGTWQQVLIPIEDVQAMYNENGFIRLIAISLENATNSDGERAYIYIGDIQFVTVSAE